jgi:nucleotide-binding universal stress UspA family protein
MAQMIPKTTYEHIAFLTDLTRKSQAALSYARAFARYYGCRLTLVHVLTDPPFPKSRTSRSYERHVQLVRSELYSLTADLQSDGISAQLYLSEAATCNHGLIQAIRHLEPDLIVQGTAGIDDARRAVVGSVAESIFRHVDTPVLTVGSRVEPLIQKELRFSRVLMLTDFGTLSEQIAIYALSLAQEFRSRISLCHVHDGRIAPWEKEAIERYFDHALSACMASPVKDWCDPEAVVSFGEVDAEIDALLQRKKPGLILMGAHSLGPLGTRGKPGTVFKVIAKAACPVLTMRDAPQALSAPSTCSDLEDLMILD